jgi:hypothetical protein
VSKKQKSKSDKTQGESKYAKKIAYRRKVALSLGLPPNSPWPVIWANQ